MRKALLVEDMDVVRATLSRMLTASGFDVKAVENADSALQAIEADKSFDILISDVVMPGGPNGDELAEMLRSDGNPIPIILITGFTKRIAELEARGVEGVSILRKPFTQRTLSDRAELMLSAGG